MKENEFNLSDVKAGDILVVRRSSYSRHAETGIDKVKVVKRGRTLLHLEATGWRETQAFYIENGIEKANGTNYLDHAYTLEGWERKQRRDAAEAALNGLSRHGWMRDLSTDQLERIASIVNESALGVPVLEKEET